MKKLGPSVEPPNVHKIALLPWYRIFKLDYQHK